MSTVALIQARVSSSRFPGKVLEMLDGVPMIVYMVRRAARAATLDRVIVATSTDPSDDPLAETLSQYSLEFVRGDLNDVLARYHTGAAHTNASVVVRLTGDCPLVDPAVVDEVVRALKSTNADYASNIDPPTFPDGFDVECFTRAALERAVREARTTAEREHVTLWMRSEAAGLKRTNVTAVADFSSLRLTVDYADDLEAVRRVVQHAGSKEFDLFDVLRCLTGHPEIMRANVHARNEGLAKSLAGT